MPHYLPPNPYAQQLVSGESQGGSMILEDVWIVFTILEYFWALSTTGWLPPSSASDTSF